MTTTTEQKIKITIRSIFGNVIFESTRGTMKEAVKEAIEAKIDMCNSDLRNQDLRGANMRGANMSGADMNCANMSGANMRGANMSGADMRSANMSGANMSGANMSGADMRGANMNCANMRGANMRGANMSGADMRGIKFENLPQQWIDTCSQQMLFIFQFAKAELPFLREKLEKGGVNGTAYLGECCCLVGSLSQGKQGIANDESKVEEYCKLAIPFYTKGLHNPAEEWFLNIHKGDTSKNNEFAKHALKLIDMILEEKKPAKKVKKISKS